MRSAMSVVCVVVALAGCGLGDGAVGAAQLSEGDAGGSGGASGSGAGGGAPSCDGDVLGTNNVDKLDLLFVVDNSGSMREEQMALREQFPRLIATLTTGVRSDGTVFPRVRSLHLGVVSTDMGLPGVPNRAGLGCGDESRPLGDDGVLRDVPNPGGDPSLSCKSGFPPFLAFFASPDPLNNQNRITELANDFACVSSLGTIGCGFEQPLEAALRALWPSDNVLPNGEPGAFVDGRPFIDNTMFGKGAPAGPNSGFLRNNVNEGQSLIAVVVVTDEEDCSSHNMGHFVPENFLAQGDPLKSVALNLRCYHEALRVGGDEARDNGEANLYATSRYVEALKALRPGRPDLVMFAAIVGVPTDLVDPSLLADVNFDNATARNAYYDGLLNDVRMIETPDTGTFNANPNLIPSCLRTVPGSDVVQRAFPPRRYIKVAKAMGENAAITSICSDDFTPAIDQIVERMSQKLGAECLPRPLARDSDGLTACEVIWELPAPNTAASNTPTQCEQRSDILSAPANGEPKHTADGRVRCVVKQVAVKPCMSGASCVNGFTPNQDPDLADERGNPLAINGWYYDDFSHEIVNCSGVDKQRIAFAENPGVDVQPPYGVTVRLLCKDQLPAACL